MRSIVCVLLAACAGVPPLDGDQDDSTAPSSSDTETSGADDTQQVGSGDDDPPDGSPSAELHLADVQMGDLRIVEVMSNTSACADESGEYVELAWFGPETLDLEGLILSDAEHEVELDDGIVIEPGERLLLGHADLEGCVGVSPAGTFDFGLSNDGELLSLVDGAGRVLFEIDITGFGAEAGVAWEAGDNDPEVWCAADTTIPGSTDLGTPGAPNGPCGNPGPVDTDVPPPAPMTADQLQPGDLLVMEIMADADDCDDDVAEYIEIFHPYPGEVELEGLELSDDNNTWVFPAGTHIGPGERILLLRDPDGESQCYGLSGLLYDAGLGLAASGDIVRLTGPGGVVAEDVDTSGWDGRGGVAWERDERDPSTWCLADRAILGATDKGSPGVPNGTCQP